MATAHQIRELITETTTGTVRPRVPREVREEVCRYAVRRRRAGEAHQIRGGKGESTTGPQVEYVAADGKILWRGWTGYMGTLSFPVRLEKGLV